MNQNTKNIGGGNIPNEIDLEVIETQLPVPFINELQSTHGPSSEYLENEAPWIKLKGETDDEYQLYLTYQSMPIHIWNMKKVFQEFDVYFNSGSLRRLAFNKFKAVAYKNQWAIRRYAYHLYIDWLDSNNEMHKQLNLIAEYRKNQGIITKKATEASILLMDKVMDRIKDIGVIHEDGVSKDNIRIQDLPKFLGAVKDIVNMSADAEARLLSINVLLELHAKEIAEMFGADGME